MKRCISCGIYSGHFASFPCPECKTEIVRCNHCREIKNPYVCTNCGFKGP